MIHNFEELARHNGDVRLEDIDDRLMTLKIKIHGEQFDSSITGDVARAIWELQAALYRAGAEILHGESNIAKLTSDERSQLELVVKVNPGCSEYDIPGKRFLLTLLNKAVEKMDSKDIKAVLFALIGAFTLVVVSPAILSYCNTKANLEALIKQAENLAAPLKAAVEGASLNVAKSAHKASQVQIGEKIFSSEDIQRLNSRSAPQSTTFDTFDAVCKVVGVRVEGRILKVDLADALSSEKFTAAIAPRELFDDNLPDSAASIGKLIDSNISVRVSVFVKENKSRSDRTITSWTVEE